MNQPVWMLGVASVGLGVALACGDGTAPSGAGCGDDEQSGVVREGDLRVTHIYITREYTGLYLGSQPTTRHYRTCQHFSCTEVREDPAAELGEAEIADALARCTGQADAAWGSGPPV